MSDPTRVLTDRQRSGAGAILGAVACAGTAGLWTALRRVSGDATIVAAAVGFGAAGGILGGLIGALSGSDTAADLDPVAPPKPDAKLTKETSHA